MQDQTVGKHPDRSIPGRPSPSSTARSGTIPNGSRTRRSRYWAAHNALWQNSMLKWLGAKEVVEI